MKPFYGTEFIEGDRAVALISIGMVREDGTEYHAVAADARHLKTRAEYLAGIAEKHG